MLLPLSYRSKDGRRPPTAACRMSFARRLLDGKPGRRLHASTPIFCTNALACECSHICTIRYLSRLTAYRFVAIPAGRGLGRPDLPGVSARPLLRISARPMIQNLAATVGLEPTSFRLTGGRSSVELHSNYVGGRHECTAGSECCSLSPERLCPNVYTIHIVKELFGA